MSPRGDVGDLGPDDSVLVISVAAELSGLHAQTLRTYDRLGLVQLRDDTERILKQNYPASTLQNRGLGGAERPWWRLW